MSTPTQLRFALAGLGSMGRNHLRVLAAHPGGRLVAVGDPDSAALSAAADQTGAARWSDPLAMAREAEFDALVIAAPTTAHRALALVAIERGLPVLVEKPLAATPAEAHEIVSAAAARGIPLQVGHVERFNPAVLELGKLLRERWLTTIYSVTSRRAGPFPARIRDVGVTVDLGTHDVDMLCWIIGERPTRVYAELAQRHHASREDMLFGLLHFPSGATGMLDVNWLTPAKRRQLSVVGEEGMFELDYLTQRLTFTRADLGKPELIGGFAPTFAGFVAEIAVQTYEPLQAQLDAFVHVVRTGERPYVNGEDGAWAVVMATALLEAASSGRSVDVPGPPGTTPLYVRRPTSSASVLGGSIHLPGRPCRHAAPREVDPWIGEEGTAGTVAVVGAGKMGLPLAAQFGGHGWNVIAVDNNPDVVASINAGRTHVGQEPGLADLVTRAHEEGRLTATGHAASAARDADVVILIVPVTLDPELRPDYRSMDAAVAAIAPGVHAGSSVIFETTLPVGDTRDRFTPVLEAAAGLVADRDFFVAFSPERLFSGAVLANLATYPKLVGGIGEASTDRAARFYASVLDAEVVAMSSSEVAEFSKLADTTYRDVNIALANEFARAADVHGIDVQEAIAGANSQPYSHIHQPGIGVGGHCIPVYPYLLLAGSPGLELVETARRVNDDQVARALAVIDPLIGGLEGTPVLVLGVTYREGVKELAYSRGVALIKALNLAGARVSAYDPLLGDEEITALDANPWHWGDTGPFRALVIQTADPVFAGLEPGWFPDLRVLFDGRNSLRALVLPAGVAYVGVGVRGFASHFRDIDHSGRDVKAIPYGLPRG